MVVLISACSQKLPHNVLTDRCLLGLSEMESTPTAQRCDFPSPSGVQKTPAGPNAELNGCCRPHRRGKESGEHLPLPLHQRGFFFFSVGVVFFVIEGPTHICKNTHTLYSSRCTNMYCTQSMHCFNYRCILFEVVHTKLLWDTHQHPVHIHACIHYRSSVSWRNQIMIRQDKSRLKDVES